VKDVFYEGKYCISTAISSSAPLGVLIRRSFSKGRRTFRLAGYRNLAEVSGQSLFGLAASRLVEDVLAELDRLDIFVGPVWGDKPRPIPMELP
jgi:hypothetical protein